jgi:UDP-galactopyranose mutase
VPNPANRELFEKYQKLASDEPGVCFVGRLASYKYFNMDQAFLNALETFDEVKGKGVLTRTELGEGDGPK